MTEAGVGMPFFPRRSFLCGVVPPTEILPPSWPAGTAQMRSAGFFPYASTFFSAVFSAAALALLIWCYVRIFSRKIAVRSEENRKYLSHRNRFLGSFRLLKSCFRQRKDYAFFRCPSCREVVRVPRGKGKIRITCPRCGYAFEKKT